MARRKEEKMIITGGKRYYIFWDEKRNNTQTTYSTFVMVPDRKAAKDIVLIEQNYRRHKDLPHMFHVFIGQHCPNVTHRAKTLYTARPDCDQETVLHIKDYLYKYGGIR